LANNIANNCKDGLCKEKALSLCDYCWRHIKDKEAYIARLEDHNKSGRPMENFNLKGLNASSINLLHANLKGANRSNAFLAGANFSDADLSGADLMGSKLSGCDFIGADCINAGFMMADLSKARFWHTDLTGADFTEADMHSADFLNAVLYKSNFYHTYLKDAHFLTRENFKGAGNNEGVSERGHKTARESYANLKQYFIEHARYNDVSWASYNENRMELRRLWKEKRPGFLPFLVMGLLCGWGERPLRAVVSAISIITLYAVIFFVFKSITPAFSPDYTPSFPDYIYYSTITFTTVGYGDFLPKANIAYKLLAGSEAFVGIFMMGLFVFTLGRRYSSR
jgi:uncharacterized protein YjbI with pentapeptide repeats